MTFIDLFSGIGGFRLGMERAGHKCLGHCEWDKYANYSYKAMHQLTGDELEELKSIPAPLKKNGEPNLNKRQKHIETIKKGDEWFANDIKTVRANDIPNADCWCFGFPCQDISVAGKQLGFSGEQSSLFYTVTSLIKQLKEENKPSYLFIENVKNLLSINKGWDFTALLIELDKIGYDAEWSVINSKDFGVPQNRERVFIIGHLRGTGRQKVFPICGENSTTIRQIANIVDTGNFDNPQRGRIYDPVGLSPALNCGGGGGLIPKILLCKLNKPFVDGKFISLKDATLRDVGCDFASTITARYYKGVGANGDNMVIRDDGLYQLTPKECFRLQGFSDEYFNRASLVNSDSQLYKQAGNSVTVNVIHRIAEKMRIGGD